MYGGSPVEDSVGRRRDRPHNQPLLWAGPRRDRILFSSGGCQRVALPATERPPLCPTYQTLPAS
jgi:hypothetical protein